MANTMVQYKKHPQGNYRPQVIIQGKAYYYIGPLQVEEDQAPKFASLYVHHPTLAGVARKNNLYLPRDTSPAERRIREIVLIELQDELKENNPFIKDSLQICQILETGMQEAAFVITEKQKPRNAGTRTYTSHHLTEVSLVVPEQAY